MKKLWLCAIILASVLVACAAPIETPQAESTSAPTQIATNIPPEMPMPSPEPSPTPTKEAFAMTIPGFSSGAFIPARYACTGENFSPEIMWNEPPEGTQSLALLFDDPDAPGGSWVHWILFNLPAETRTLPDHLPGAASYEDGSKSGANSWSETSYGGPCPPEGTTHEYVFYLYALDAHLELPAGSNKADLLTAIEGHILGQAQYTGVFGR